MLEELIKDDIAHSLATHLKYSYIDFPGNVNVQINGEQASCQNPFGNIITYVIEDESLALKGQTQDFRYWIIPQSKLEMIEAQNKV